jgi:hypothetical protein
MCADQPSYELKFFVGLDDSGGVAEIVERPDYFPPIEQVAPDLIQPILSQYKNRLRQFP